MSASLEDERITAVGLFLEAHAELVGVLDRELRAACGLRLKWLEVLIRLARSPGQSLTASDLARAVVLSSGGATRLVDRLEHDGLIQRRADERDRRIVRVALTERGHAVLGSALPAHLESIDRHLVASLGADRVNSLAEVSRALRDGLSGRSS
ncbi:MAG: MarR family transcriptional regulator [Acidimicrobiia bacterium]|nr:MarR family transcriptional regulator [Acidimicrobiia bacterium]